MTLYSLNNREILLVQADHYSFKYKNAGPDFENNKNHKIKTLDSTLIDKFCMQINGTFVYIIFNNRKLFKLVFATLKQ